MSHRSSNPFDNDDELQNEYDDVGMASSEPVYVPLGDTEANSAARNQMRKYVSKNRLKFQKHFQRASSHLDSEGLDNEVLDCRDETPERITKFLWSDRGAFIMSYLLIQHRLFSQLTKPCTRFP